MNAKVKKRDPRVPTTVHRYQGKSVAVFDGVLEGRAMTAFANYVSSLLYERRPSFDNELSIGLDNDFYESLPILPEFCEEVLKRSYADLSAHRSPQKLSHTYCAAMRYGDNTMIHRDIHCPDCMTFLYYANVYWHPEWGGETIFYDDDKNAMFAVNPKPGRLVLFNAQLYHRTGIPQRDCSSHRYGMSVFYRCQKQIDLGKVSSG